MCRELTISFPDLVIILFFPLHRIVRKHIFSNRQGIRACNPSLEGLTKGALQTSPKNETIRMKEIDARSATGLAVVTLLECSASAITLVPVVASRWLIIPFSFFVVLCLKSNSFARAWRYSPRTSRPEPSRITDPTWREFGLRKKPCPRGCDLLLYVASAVADSPFLSGSRSRRRARTKPPLIPPRALSWLVFEMVREDKFRGLF